MKKILLAVLIALAIYGGFQVLLNDKFDPLLGDYKCTINDVDYFVYMDVIYTPGSDAKEYIYTDFGVWERKPTKDGWILKAHANNHESIYVTVFDWMETGRHSSGSKVVCKNVDKLPEGFQIFIDTHQPLFDARKFKQLE